MSLRADRLSSCEQWSPPQAEAILNEFRHGRRVLESGETAAGATKFRDGKGRHGSFD